MRLHNLTNDNVVTFNHELEYKAKSQKILSLKHLTQRCTEAINTLFNGFFGVLHLTNNSWFVFVILSLFGNQNHTCRLLLFQNIPLRWLRAKRYKWNMSKEGRKEVSFEVFEPLISKGYLKQTFMSFFFLWTHP